VLRAILPAVPAAPAVPARVGRPPLNRPVFIIAAPRSGSTLLFETLACSANLVTLGGEAHWLVEDLEALRPGAPGVESNRLTAAQATAATYEHMLETIAGRLRDAHDAPVPLRPDSRLLEKTPKNALRVPFFNRLFPDALFVFLWRDPRENLSSIIEAWRSGRWKTYNGLDGFDGPWSLLLPPGWRALNGRPLEEIAAFQWSSANRIALDDLAQLEPARWMSLNHAQFVADPAAHVERICRFIGIEMDPSLASRVSQPLPPSRFTQTPPDADKWRRNAGRIEPVLPMVEHVWRRLQTLA
jgi:LPS sulfotransferase NodH